MDHIIYLFLIMLPSIHHLFVDLYILVSNKTIHSNKESLGVPFNTEFTYKDLLLVLIKYIFPHFSLE